MKTRSLKTQILDRRIPYIAVYHEDSQIADLNFSALQFAVSSFKVSHFRRSQFKFQVRRSQLSQFAVSVWRSQLSKSQVWGFKVLSFRSFNFEVSTLNFQISHFPKFDSSFPFVSLAFSDDIRTLELLDKQLRFRHCRLLLYETSDDDSQSALALTLSANDSLADESTHAVFRAVTLLFRLNRGYSELNLLVSARSTVSALFGSVGTMAFYLHFVCVHW